MTSSRSPVRICVFRTKVQPPSVALDSSREHRKAQGQTLERVGIFLAEWCAVARVLQAGAEGPFPPLQLTMLWNLCVDMTSSGAPVLDRLPLYWLSQVAGVLPALLCEKILFSCYLVRVSAVHETCTCTCALPETNPRLPADSLCV